ncbi:MAG: hypothetical protein ABSH13_22490, partial [Candidatus Acidiferrum sp.]
TPHVAFLLRRKPKPFPRLHKHHLLKTALYKMVLPRPSEPARLIGRWDASLRYYANEAALVLPSYEGIESRL